MEESRVIFKCGSLEFSEEQRQIRERQEKVEGDRAHSRVKMWPFREQLTTKVNLHRTFAKLYELKTEYKEAINELKQAVFATLCRFTSKALSGGLSIPTLRPAIS